MKQRLFIALLAIFAILSAIGGYSGLFDELTRDPYRDIKEEFLTVVEKAQIWYSQPVSRGGGGRSFIDFDFRRIGLSDKSGSITYQGEHGRFLIASLQDQSFGLIGIARDSTELKMDKIRFDTRVQYK